MEPSGFLYVSVFLSLIYFVTLPPAGTVLLRNRYLAGIKGFSTLLLGFFALVALQNKLGILVFLAFLFSAIGDVFLGLDQDKFFFKGLFSFAFAHLFYIFIFLLFVQFPIVLPFYKLFLIIIVVLSSSMMFLRLASNLGKLKRAIFVYISILIAMLLIAILANLLNPLAIVGVLLFAFSDSLIAQEKFLRPFKGIGYLIWICYYIGQLLIALGIVRS